MCFLGALPTLGLESATVGDGFGVDALRLNHFDGLVRNWVNPEDGDAERGSPGPVELLGANESCGASELGGMARFGAIYDSMLYTGENGGLGRRSRVCVVDGLRQNVIKMETLLIGFGFRPRSMSDTQHLKPRHGLTVTKS